MKNADTPAMPQSATENGYGCNYGNEPGQVPTGLTKREMIAMHAMRGLLSSDDSSVCFYKDSSDAVHIAKSAVAYADALLKELEK